jgi:hypothetical protein
MEILQVPYEVAITTTSSSCDSNLAKNEEGLSSSLSSSFYTFISSLSRENISVNSHAITEAAVVSSSHYVYLIERRN